MISIPCLPALGRIGIGLRASGAAIALSAALAGCGGGGGSDTPEVTPSGVFAAPAGTLCASRNAQGHCVQPTATSATATQVLSAITNPSGEVFKVDAFGWEQRWTYQASNGQITHSAHAYGHGRKPVLIGRNRVELEGRTYSFSRKLDANQAEFVSADPPGSVTVSVLSPEVLSVVVASGSGQVTGGLGSPGGLQQTVDSTVWSAEIGLTTDRSDAVTGNAVIYAGTITVFGGDGRPTGVRNLLNVTSASCPITLEFNATTGLLSVRTVQCTTGDGGTVGFTLASDFDVTDSVLKSRSALQGIASVAGPASGDTQREAPMVSSSFALTAVDGQFFGRGARWLHLSGAGVGGAFYIKAQRQ